MGEEIRAAPEPEGTFGMSSGQGGQGRLRRIDVCPNAGHPPPQAICARASGTRGPWANNKAQGCRVLGQNSRDLGTSRRPPFKVGGARADAARARPTKRCVNRRRVWCFAYSCLLSATLGAAVAGGSR